MVCNHWQNPVLLGCFELNFRILGPAKTQINLHPRFSPPKCLNDKTIKYWPNGSLLTTESFQPIIAPHQIISLCPEFRVKPSQCILYSLKMGRISIFCFVFKWGNAFFSTRRFNVKRLFIIKDYLIWIRHNILFLLQTFPSPAAAWFYHFYGIAGANRERKSYAVCEKYTQPV